MMKLASNFGKQIPRNRLQQFVFRLHLQNLWCSKSFSRCQSKEDAVFWQTLKSSRRSPESRPACFTPEKLSVRGWDIIAAFINWTSSFKALKKKLFKSAPLKSIDAKLQQGNALWHYGNVWEGNRVSWPAICSWFWTNSSSKWTCSNTFLVNKMLTQEYIFDH